MHRIDPCAEIDLKLFQIWMSASRTVFGNVIKEMKHHGLTAESFMVLELLYNKGPQYIQTISEKLAIPSGSITYVVNKLEKNEWVKKEQDPSNRRFWKVILTKKGVQFFHEIFPKHVEVIVDHFRSLTKQQKEELGHFLQTVGQTAQQLKK